MEKLNDFLTIFSVNETVIKIIVTIGIIYIVSIIKLQLSKFINEKIESDSIAYKLNQAKNVILNVIFLIIFVQIWFSVFQSISTFLGLITAGLAIALKDIISDVAGYIYISVKKPFILGDRIQLGDIQGDVLEISFLHFTVLEIGNWVDADQSTGRIVHIPSAKILNDSLFNYNKGFNWIWNEVNVLLTFDSNWKLAKDKLQVLVETLLEDDLLVIKKDMKRAKKNLLVSYSNVTPIIYTQAKDSGINLTIRYLCNPKNRRGSETLLWESILDLHKTSSFMDLAYPTSKLILSK
jgi:small-conductance mechanosensitive channel